MLIPSASHIADVSDNPLSNALAICQVSLARYRLISIEVILLPDDNIIKGKRVVRQSIGLLSSIILSPYLIIISSIIIVIDRIIDYFIKGSVKDKKG